MLKLTNLSNLKEKNLQIYGFNIKNVYVDMLTNIVNEYNIKYQVSNKMKPDFVTSSTPNGFGRENHVIVSK